MGINLPYTKGNVDKFRTGASIPAIPGQRYFDCIVEKISVREETVLLQTVVELSFVPPF